MGWFKIILFLGVVSAGLSINRPVYKIELSQKGYAQFIQYDVETPPIREFTFCTWFRIYDLLGDQTIFTYVANGNNRIIRLWLDSGGNSIHISINGKASSSTIAEIKKNVWRNICLSYQADFGAWALYLDSRLVSCQTSQTLVGYVLPEDGSVIIGYGTNTNGDQNGLHGEIFGANMILMSSIERNFTVKNDPKFSQKFFIQNKLKEGEHYSDYVILDDLKTKTVPINYFGTNSPSVQNVTKHNDIYNLPGESLGQGTTIREKDIYDFSEHQKETTSEYDNWHSHRTPSIKNFERNKNSQSHGSDILAGLPTISEYVEPPRAPSFKTLEGPLQDTTTRYTVKKKTSDELSTYETPPPIDTNSKVYGQWTSSKFAGNVLNYLNGLRLRKQEQNKVFQQTISDSYPYPSEFKITKVRPPSQFQRRNVVEKQLFDNKRTPQINVHILEDDLRSNIIKYHAQIMPKNVEIHNRAKPRKRQEHRFYRHVNYEEMNQESTESIETELYSSKLRPIKGKDVNQNTNPEIQHENLMSILPFLKSLEYLIDEPTILDQNKSRDIYTRSLSLGNKWHNVKSYNNDYTPRELKYGYDNSHKSIENKIVQYNKQPSQRLNNNNEDRSKGELILRGRALAMEVSNQSEHNKDILSLLKSKNSFSPIKTHFSLHQKPKINEYYKDINIRHTLTAHQPKISSIYQDKRNAERENEIFTLSRQYGDNKSITSRTPQGTKVCNNVEFYHRVLYVQPDGSIDMTHIMSPVKIKNTAVDFIVQNYKMCSLQESDLKHNLMLYIDWGKTPVRLFGGAYPKKTTDLCGFF